MSIDNCWERTLPWWQNEVSSNHDSVRTNARAAVCYWRQICDVLNTYAIAILNAVLSYVQRRILVVGPVRQKLIGLLRKNRKEK